MTIKFTEAEKRKILTQITSLFSCSNPEEREYHYRKNGILPIEYEQIRKVEQLEIENHTNK